MQVLDCKSLAPVYNHHFHQRGFTLGPLLLRLPDSDFPNFTTLTTLFFVIDHGRRFVDFERPPCNT